MIFSPADGSVRRFIKFDISETDSVSIIRIVIRLHMPFAPSVNSWVAWLVV
jgi:hypothetical protein